MMNRREFLIKSAILGSATLLPLNRIARLFQDDPFTEIRRNVGTFVLSGGTIGWLINDDGIVVVDSQYPDNAAQCVEGIESRTKVDFDLLLNTHHHGDHTGGNMAFAGKVKHIVAHQNVPDLQRTAAERSAERNGPEVLERQAYADVTFETEWSEDVGDETVHMKYYGRAHTSGDSVIYFEKANVAHMGDLVFNRVHPFIDRGSGASIKNWIEVLRSTASDLPQDAIYIFGHGNSEYGITGSADDLIHKSNFLEELLAYTQKGIDAGKSKEEISDLEALPGFEEFNAPGWGLTLSRDLSTAYDELTEG